MTILKRIKTGWRAMTTMDKVKLVMNMVCGFGCSVVVDDIAQKHCQGKNILEKVAIHVGTWGLGMAAGNAAGKALEEAMDDYVMLYQIYKQDKKDKEETANA